MNKKLKKELNDIVGELEGVRMKVEKHIERASDEYDELSEKAQEATKGLLLESQIELLRDAENEIDMALTSLVTVIEEAY